MSTLGNDHHQSDRRDTFGVGVWPAVGLVAAVLLMTGCGPGSNLWNRGGPQASGTLLSTEELPGNPLPEERSAGTSLWSDDLSSGPSPSDTFFSDGGLGLGGFSRRANEVERSLGVGR